MQAMLGGCSSPRTLTRRSWGSRRFGGSVGLVVRREVWVTRGERVAGAQPDSVVRSSSLRRDGGGTEVIMEGTDQKF